MSSLAWMELHKICSPILQQESRKSTRTATTTQQFSPFWRQPVMIHNRLQIVQNSIFIKRDGTVSWTVELVLSGVTASPCSRFLLLFPLHHQLFRTRGGGLGSFVYCTFQAFLQHHIAVGSLAGASPQSRPKVGGKSKPMQVFPSCILGYWGEWVM